MASMLIVHAGLQTTVQDAGRWGFQALGVPVSGPMDRSAHRLANALAGNEPAAAALEVTLSGPELVFDDRRLIAVTGADFDLTIDGEAAPMYTRMAVRAGGRLRFGERRRGARAYVAVSGGLDVPIVLGSRATHVGSGMGGFKGRVLAAGDRLPLGIAPEDAPMARATISQDEMAALARLAPEGRRLRIVPGPEHDRFTTDAVDALLSGGYEVGPESNRMGYRLTGPALPNTVGAGLLSGATAAGTLQVPASGTPLLLMADRQTTGGYARIAAVISADLDAAGQLAPGDRLTFEMCTLRDALGALVAREQVLMGIEARVAQ